MNFIPPLDLKTQYSLIQEEVSAAVNEVLQSGRYIKGPSVEQFEQQFATFVGTSDCIACNSGTDALYLALRAFGIGPGDEVITTPFTFIATAETITAVGATPVFVDIDPHTLNLDVSQIELAVTDRTRAIVPVHLFGQPVDMTALMAIAQAHGLLVIEDCAQAVGAEWQGQKVGSIGHAGCFSFYPTKNLGACGDGGAVTTRDGAIARQIRVLGDHGRTAGYIHEAIGINSRLDAIQAVILSIKLRHLEQWNQQRQAVAHRYRELLGRIADIALPSPLPQGQSVWHQYTIRLKQARLGSEYRDRVRQSLSDQGVGSMVYYPVPLHQQPAYRTADQPTCVLPVAEQAAQEVLSLPMFPELTPQQQETITYALKDALTQAQASKEAEVD
ncbi:MAG: DegT/DnrJ/EryC1/StrS family aminotransferase [Synechococcales bacterium]|nr:DegT/DnrJ/EryC1/StrS family aminotransferase [Synechococcales bacterium]